jgi:hypothetical protein
MIYIPNTLYAATTDFKVGLWSRRAGTFGNVDVGRWKIRALAWDPAGIMFGVGSSTSASPSALVRWNGKEWEEVELAKGFSPFPLSNIAFGPDKKMWGVGVNGSVAKWNGGFFQNEDSLGPTPLLSLAFDASGTMWGVKKGGNVAPWDSSKHAWGEFTPLGGWAVIQLAFDSDGNRWCVGALRNVGRWTGAGWRDERWLGDWKVEWLAWSPSAAPDSPYAEIGDQARACAATLGKGTLPAFRADPITYLTNNKVNLDFLSGTQLTNLAHIIAGDDEFSRIGQGKPIDARGWECRIALWIVFAAVDAATTYFTSGQKALLSDAACTAIGSALAIDPKDVRFAGTQIDPRDFTMNKLIAKLCSMEKPSR